MSSDISQSDAAQFAEYELLASQYRDSVARCQASVDQLRAGGRELRELATKLGRDIKPDATPDAAEDLDRILRRNSTPAPNGNLSERERQVLGMLGQGFTTHAIAERLDIRSSTVETYRERLKNKLSLNSGNELIRYAVLWFASQDGRDE